MHRNLRGFSLIELLVVVSLIIMLIAILLPGLHRTRAIARSTICANNLRSIDQARHSRDQRLKITGKRGFDDPSGGWPSVLLPFLGNEALTLVCPEDDKLSGGGPDAIIDCWLGGNPYFQTDFNESPLQAKLSQTQLDAANLAENQNQWVPPAYQPDGDPHIFYLCIEDIRPGGGDKDYEDLIIKIEELPGEFELTFMKGHTNRHFKLLDAHGVVLVDNCTNQTVRIPGGSSSYAFNRYFWSERRPDMVAALDYDDFVIANAAGPDADQDWDDMIPDGKEHPSFARHGDGINVLFGSGNVQTSVKPVDLDPAVGPINEALWLPEDLLP